MGQPEEDFCLNSIPKDGPLLWPEFDALPLEMWAEIAAVSDRQTVASLSAVCHAFHAIARPILYRIKVTADPPLTARQTRFLVDLLRDDQFYTHFDEDSSPEHLIQSLCLPNRSNYFIDVTRELEALSNLVEVAFLDESQVIRSVTLRSLDWNCDQGCEELTDLLLMPDYFPNLKHLSIKCQVVYEGDEQIPSRFDFIRVPGLESLQCDLTFPYYSEPFEPDCKPAWRIIRQHLGNLPTLSPDLHTLSLHIRLRAHPDPPREWDLDTDLATAINELCLPALRSFDFSIYTVGFNIRNDDDIDFAPMDLTLNVQGVFIPPDLCLPRLRSFTGRFNDCATILENPRELHHLTVVFPEDEPMPPVWMSYPNYTVRSLDARSVAAAGRLCRYPSLISEATLTYLAVVLPKLTHLDVSLAEHMVCVFVSIQPRISFAPCLNYFTLQSHYRDAFLALPALQHLGLCVHQRVHRNDYYLDPTAVVPPTASPPRSTATPPSSVPYRTSPEYTSSSGVHAPR
ncbi:hypothetical protein B0H16DRAFT_1567525 [Mycena metata]|uniref:F-box domain-containing protein n=1 Tax=Mycena metata TaxID=1033252 RepID=A0AAD7ID43_9AGAR|nr:hypothetical protein B0H16DRAFT_1567525 [Mycena metata]